MGYDILFTMGLEGEADYLSQISRLVNLTNTAFSRVAIPQINIPQIPSIPQINIPTPNVNPAPFNLATASVGELSREYSRLQRGFTQGADTSQIVAVRDRLRDLRVEMGAINPQSFTQRLGAAFSNSLSDAANWKDKLLTIVGGNLIADSLQKLGQGFVDVGKFAINSAGRFESIRASLDVLTGSAENGQAVFSQFSNLAAKSPFNFDNVAEQGSKLIAMGIPIADVTDRLSRLGDIAAGVGREKLPNIAFVFGQIKTAGRAMSGDLNQIMNAGVPIIDELAKVMKKPAAEIKKLAADSKIGFKEIDAAFISMTSKGGKFHEMMKTQSNTFEGLYSSMEDAFQLLGVAIGNEVLPTVKELVIATTEAVNYVAALANGTKQIESTPIRVFVQSLQLIGAITFEGLGIAFSAIANNAGLAAVGVTGLAIALNATKIAEQGNIAVTAIGNGLRVARQVIMSETLAISLLGLGAYVRENVAMLVSNAQITAQIALRTALNFVTGNWVAILIVAAGALTAAYAAYKIYNNEASKGAAFSKEVIDAKQSLAAEYTKERTKLDGLFGVLNNEGAKREDQVKAAKLVISNYKDLLPKYVTEESLLRKGSAAIADRNVVLEELRRKTLETVASNVKAQAMEGLSSQLVKITQAKQLFDEFNVGQLNAYERISKARELGIDVGYIGEITSTVSTGQRIYEAANAQIAKIKASINSIDGTWEATMQSVMGHVNDMPLDKSFNLNAVSGGIGSGSEEAAAKVEFLKGSMEALKSTLKELEEKQSKFTVAGQKEYVALEDKIGNVKDKIKAIEDAMAQRGLGSGSIGQLNIQLKQFRENLDKASPNSNLLKSSAISAAALEDKIKAVQDRIKEFSLTKDSLEFVTFKLSQVKELMEKQPESSGLIPTLIGQKKELEEQDRRLKIALGLEPTRNSLAGMQNDLSALNKELSELPTNSPFEAVDRLNNSTLTLSGSIKQIEFERALGQTAKGSIQNLDLQISNISERLNQLPSDSGLIPGLIAQSRELSETLRDVKIRMGLEPPRDSLEGFGTTISDLNKQLNALSVDNCIDEFLYFGGQIKAAEEQTDLFNAKLEAMRLHLGQKSVLKVVTLDKADFDRIKFLEEEIAKLEKLPIIKISAKLELENYKSELDKLKSGINDENVLKEWDATNSPVLDKGFGQIISPDLNTPKAPQIPIPEMPAVASFEDFDTKVYKMGVNFAESLGVMKKHAQDFGGILLEVFDKAGEQISQGIASGLGNAASAFGEGLGNMIMGMGTFEDAMIGSLFALGDAILVQIPKTVGLGLIQSAFTPQALATFPANLALAAAGLALVGASSGIGAILGGLQKKRETEKEDKLDIPKLNQALPKDQNEKIKQAAGLSGLNAEKRVMINNVNITMPVYGLDGVILKTIEQRQIIEREINQ